MKLVDVLKRAADAYASDGTMHRAFDPETGKLVRGVCGDTLAEFLVSEIRDTFDADAMEVDQLRTVARAITTARGQLQDVAISLGGSDFKQDPSENHDFVIPNWFDIEHISDMMDAPLTYSQFETIRRMVLNDDAFPDTISTEMQSWIETNRARIDDAIQAEESER